MKKPSANQASSRLPHTPWYFRAGLVLLPLALLLLTELLLRLTGYGKPYPLFIKGERFGKEKFLVNRAVAHRYFWLPEPLIPEASEDAFDTVKTPRHFRIFCIGGSTTAGFPYEINVPFPFQLQHRLQTLFPEKKIEVVNLGISAINSFSVLDLLPEVLAAEPDLLLVYMGHNEFYGAYGAGSSLGIGSNRTVILTYLKLRRLRLVRMVESLVGAARSAFRDSRGESGNLMQRMIGKREIPYSSPVFKAGLENFRKNLTAILASCQKQHTPVILSALVSNLKDFSPFVSAHSSSLAPADRRKWDRLYRQGLEFRRQNRPDSALAYFRKAERIDSSFAQLFFEKAKALLALEDSAAAYKNFAKAKDLDVLRFRAPDTMNALIKQAAARHGIAVLDLEAIFRAASPLGIPGKELFLEHLHPNFNGYRLMAQSFAEAVVQWGFLEEKRTTAIAERPEINREDILRNYQSDSAGVTLLDLEFGSLRNFLLTGQWPFRGERKSISDYIPIGTQETHQIALQHIQKKLFWDASHFELARRYEAAKSPWRAWAEYRAVYLAFPDNYFPAMKIGDIYLSTNRLEEALRWYEISLKAKPDNPNVLAKTGNVVSAQGHFRRAIAYLEEALRLDRDVNSFSTAQKTLLFYLIGLNYANLKNWSLARENLDAALSLNPSFQPAKNLLSQINKVHQSP